MKKLLIVSVLLGVITTGLMSGTAAAWHPKGQIKKSVQNVTSGGQLVDANDTKTAITAQPGDVLKYVIVVSNTGAADSRGWNDMHYTALSDDLPAGVELVSNASQRKISEDLGVIKPGQKVTKEYTVKVKADQTDKAVITNKACFTGNSSVKDAPQSGCDNAVVVTIVPKTSSTKTEEQPKGQGSTPKVEAAVTTPKVEAAVTTLPETGPEQIFGVFASISSAGYITHRITSRKRR